MVLAYWSDTCTSMLKTLSWKSRLERFFEVKSSMLMDMLWALLTRLLWVISGMSVVEFDTSVPSSLFKSVVSFKSDMS